MHPASALEWLQGRRLAVGNGYGTSVNRPGDAVEIDTTVTKDGVVSIAGSSHLIGFAWARRRVHPATRRAPRLVGKTRYVSASVRNLSANRREVPSQRARAPNT